MEVFEEEEVVKINEFGTRHAFCPYCDSHATTTTEMITTTKYQRTGDQIYTEEAIETLKCLDCKKEFLVPYTETNLCEHHKDPDTKVGRKIIYTDDLGYKYCNMCIGNLFNFLMEGGILGVPTFLMSKEEEQAFHWVLGREELARRGEERDILSKLLERLKLGAPDFPIIQIQKELGEPSVYKLEGEMALEVGHCYEVVCGTKELDEFILVKNQGDIPKEKNTTTRDIPETLLPICPICREEMLPEGRFWKCENMCNIEKEFLKISLREFLKDR